MKFVVVNEVEVRVLGDSFFHVLASDAVVLLVGNEIILVLEKLAIVVRVEPVLLLLILFGFVSAVCVAIALACQFAVINIIVGPVIIGIEHL